MCQRAVINFVDECYSYADELITVLILTLHENSQPDMKKNMCLNYSSTKNK